MFAYNKPGPGAPNAGGGDQIPLYDPDELELLRDELLEAYSTPRENLHTRDEEAAIKRNETAVKEHQKLAVKSLKEDAIKLKLKAKQDALRRLYQSVILEKTQGKKRRSKSTKSSFSSESFHKMYTVYRDPTKGGKAKIIEGKDYDDDDEDDDAGTDKVSSVKVVDAKVAPPPSKVEEMDKQTDTSSAKERSKFVLKQRLSSLKSKPPPLMESLKHRTSREMRKRDDARYSEGKDRYSFDVDVLGPFLNYIDPLRPPPRMRTIATQAMMADDIRSSQDYGDMGSQTDFEVISWRGSSKKGSQNIDGYYEDEDEYQEQAAGDASSSNPSDHDEDELEDSEEKGKVLERKESKRREAETMARPRGYRDLDLREELPFVTFEAETHVTSHDLEREEARQRGFSLSRDNILWPRCSEFDMDTAAKKIEDYIKRCWNLDPKWLFYIQPLEVYHDSYRKKYVFEVKFSVPSPTVPVPPATASVFFVFEIPIYSMKDDTVKVSYVLEGTRFAHSPGKIPFQDKWLWGIVSDKLRVQKAVNL